MRCFLRKTLHGCILLLPIIFLFVSTCSDEFSLLESDLSLTDDWRETAAVYANIDMNSNKHFIRVNRGFTTENFYDANTIFDSIYFDPLEIEVKLYKLKVNSMVEHQILDADTLEIFLCRDTLIKKDSIGSFSVEYVPLYYVETSSFAVNESDNLYIGLEVITPDNRIISHTKIIEKSEFVNPSQELSSFPILNSTFDVEFVNPIGTYFTHVQCFCSYKELTEIDGVRKITTKPFSFEIGNINRNSPVTSYESFLSRNNTDIFYRAIENDILNNGDTINTIARAMGKILFRAYSGNRDMAINRLITGGHVSGFGQDLPTYSNIDNAHGYFTGYITIDSKELQLSYETIDSVINLYGYKYHFQRVLK